MSGIRRPDHDPGDGRAATLRDNLPAESRHLKFQPITARRGEVRSAKIIHRAMMCSKSGFTLLEVLLATTLTAAVTLATFSWIHTQTRANRAASVRLQAIATTDTTAAAIRDDLLQTVADSRGRRFEMQGKELRLTTLNHMPGDPLGAKRVVWRQDGKTNALVREIKPADPEAPPIIRAVSRKLELVRFSKSGAGGDILLLTCRTEQGKELTVPLTLVGIP